MAGGGAYSNTVRLLKLALPVMALGLVAAVLLINEKEVFEGGLNFTKADLEALGEGLKVSNPNLSGVTKDGDVYNFYATDAVPADLELTKITVSDIRGSVQLKDSILIYITAITAKFDFADQEMEMPDGANLTTSDGYTFHADRLDADLENAGLTGEGRIRATGPMGTISADKLRIEPANADDELTQTQVIWLEDNVRLVYDPAVSGEE